MSRLLGRSAVRFTHAADPILLKRGDQKISLPKLCEEVTPPCWLNPLLFNGHMQTMWTAIADQDIPIYYKRHIFTAELPDYEGTFAVDFAVPPYNAERDPSLPDRTSQFTHNEFESLGGNDDKPMIICLHGLSGGSYEIYLRAVLKPLLDAGWEACVVNGRGCAESKITSGVLYNARATWDVRQIVKWVREKWPRRQLFGIGFSLGANIITNYIAEEGESCLLKAAVVCSNPWNLDVSAQLMQSSWFDTEVYLKTMGTNMRQLAFRHEEVLRKNTRIDFDVIKKVKYLHEFDRAMQGPVWGYPTENAYYRDASSVDSLFAVRIPLLAINAEDDPISQFAAIPFEEFKQNPYLVMCSTTLGGHLSWFEIGGSRWFAKPASNFLNAMAQDTMEVIEPEWRAPGGTGKPGISIAHDPPPFRPMRRKMKMVTDEN